MSQTSLRWLLVLTAGAALAVFFVLRISLTLHAWGQAADGDGYGWLPWWTLDTVATALLFVATVAGCGWLAARAHRRERKQTRVEHLAEMGLLAGGLAHEIRNTLNAMHSQIGLLRKYLRQGANAEAVERTGQMERAVAELEQLVSDFLAFARPAKDRLDDVDLATLIRGVLDFTALGLEQAGVTVITELDSALPSVHADADKLKRVLLNLIINARQAMPEGGTLTVRAQAAGRGAVVIEVSDTGCGIPEGDRPRIFQTFFSTKPDGTGLGLAVVKRTIDDCGGRITFDSEVGRGTTFRIVLPAGERQRGLRERPARAEQTVVMGA